VININIIIIITTKRGDKLGTKWTVVSFTLPDSFCTGRRDPSSHSNEATLVVMKHSAATLTAAHKIEHYATENLKMTYSCRNMLFLHTIYYYS
jgi:hypothetical protein